MEHKKGIAPKQDDPPVSQGNPLRPKKAISAYLFYNTQMVAKLKVDKGLSQKEAFKMSGEIWKSMSDKEKAKYVALQKKDEERY